MSSERDGYQRTKDLFCRAQELTGAARARFLDDACADEPELRAAVERLLAAHEDDSGLLDVDADARRGAVPARWTAARPESIGPYRITGVLGEGGMGIVFRAEQQRPRREVALKVMRGAPWVEETLRRFEREAEVLGRLHHEGIAQVYEAGTAEVGGATVPFFALELVEGVPLTEYARREGLSAARRVELLARVCDAVEHAHNKAVIHRDLKPGNVLVDGRGRVKVLDFGIARVADAQAGGTLQFTRTGMPIGTLAYMSPEQAGGGPEEHDTRSDVYSLGVVAFELLAGRLPHDLDDCTLVEALRRVVDEEPLRIEAAEPRIDPDLATVVGKAIEKDPARRYASAAALAEDLRRYLRHEPIAARPPSTTYQLRKFARRNRALVGGAGATMAALVVGLVVSLVQYSDARAAGAVAVRQAAKAQAVNDFLLQDMLGSPNPWDERGDVMVSQVLDDAAGRVEARFGDEPELEAAVRATLGGSYMALGLFDAADEHLAEALRLRRELHDGDDEELARSLLACGQLRWNRGDGARAEELLREAIDMSRRLFGDVHPLVADGLLGLGRALEIEGDYDGARAAFEECRAVLEGLRTGVGLDLLNVLNELGGVEYYAQRFEAGLEYKRQALALARRNLGESSPYVAICLNNLAESLMKAYPDERGREEWGLLRESLERFEAALGGEHPVTLRTRRNLGVALQRAGELDAAGALLRESYEQTVAALGPAHIDALQSGNALANYLMSIGELDDAGQLYDEIVPRARESLGDLHPDTLVPVFNLAWLRRKQGDPDAAEALYREALAGFEEAHGPRSSRALGAHKDLVLFLIERGELEEAGERLRAILAHEEVLHEPEYASILIDVARAANELGGAALRDEEYERAAGYLEEGYRLCRTMWDARDWRSADTESKLGEALARVGRTEEARRHLRGAFEALRDPEGGGSQLAAAARRRLVEFYERNGEGEAADALPD